MQETAATFRQQAEHCRELALALNDEPTIRVLLAMAQEYDEKADDVENCRLKSKRRL